MIKGFCYIMLFYVLGEMMSLLIGKLIPGSVCGMILLFIALTLKWIRPHDVYKAASQYGSVFRSRQHRANARI